MQQSLDNLKEQVRINAGVEDVLGKLYKDFGFHELFSSAHQKTLRNVLFARVLEPGSKRRLSFVAEKNLTEELPLDRIIQNDGCPYKKRR